MENKTKVPVRSRFSGKTRRRLLKSVYLYAEEVVDILGFLNFNEIMIFIDPVLTRLKCEWGTSDPNIIAAAMYKYSYIEGKSDERKRKAVK